MERLRKLGMEMVLGHSDTGIDVFLQRRDGSGRVLVQCVTDISEIDHDGIARYAESKYIGGRRGKKANADEWMPSPREMVEDLICEGSEVDDIISMCEYMIGEAQKEISSLSAARHKMDGSYLERKRNANRRISALMADIGRYREVMRIAPEYEGLHEPDPPAADTSSILKDTNPRDGYEFISQMIARKAIRIDIDDFKRQSGYRRTDISKMVCVFVRKEKGGVSVDHAAELVVSYANDCGCGHMFTDDYKAKCMLLDFFSMVRTNGDISGYIRRNREREADEVAETSRSEYVRSVEAEYGMPYEEAISYISSFNGKRAFFLQLSKVWQFLY